MISPAAAYRKRSFRRLRSINNSTLYSDIETNSLNKNIMSATASRSTTGRMGGNPEAQTSAPRGRNRPTPLPTRFRVPPLDRYRTMVEPTDPDFIQVESYFERLLRDHTLTINYILQEHFIPYEIDLIIPTNKEPMASDQAEETGYYNDLLKNRFKGKSPTVAFKLTLLFFGVSVAPLKPVVGQAVDPRDFDDFDEDREIPRDPLAFLDEYATRTYGDNHGNSIPSK
jgi:hypothetical protein